MPPTTRSKARRAATAGAKGAAAAANKRSKKTASEAPAQLPAGRGTGRKRQQAAEAPQPSTRRRTAPEPRASSAAGAAPSKIRINRAPVLALWVATVAERQGFTFEEGLTFGRWVSGTLAQSKGRSLGIYEPHDLTPEEREARRRRDEAAGVHRVDAFGMHIPAIQVGQRSYAASGGRPGNPDAERGYLERAFGEQGLAAARSAMEHLAGSIPQADIGRAAYRLYERFRPEWHGWGQKGELDLGAIRQLATSWREA